MTRPITVLRVPTTVLRTYCAQWVEINSEREFVNEEKYLKYCNYTDPATNFESINLFETKYGLSGLISAWKEVTN